MSIEAYADTMIYFHMGLFLLLIIIGLVAIWNRIRKKTLKHWWIIPYAVCYSISAAFGTFTAFIAYDDPADPNYGTYAGWKLCDFISNDIKRFIIWFVIGVLLYFIFERKERKKLIKTRRAMALMFVTILLVLITLLLFTGVSASPPFISTK